MSGPETLLKLVSPGIDVRAGEAGKTDGMIRAEANASPAWIEEAVAAIRRVALRSASFTSDDVWIEGLEHPREARALGPCFIRARALGYVEPTDAFVLTAQTKRHRAPVRVWKSLLFRETWGRERVEAFLRGKR